MADTPSQRPQASSASPIRPLARPLAAPEGDAALAALDALQALEALGDGDSWPATPPSVAAVSAAPVQDAGDLDLLPAAGPSPLADDDGLGAWLGSLEGAGDEPGRETDAADSGEVTPAALPLLLGDLRARRRSGLLLIQAGADQCRLAFAAGELVDVAGSRREHQLAGLLLARGLLSASALEQAAREAREHERGLGGWLVEQGLLDEPTLRQARAAQARRVLTDLLACDDGDYLFGPRERAADDDARLPTADLLLELVRAFDDPDMVRFALGDLNAVLSIAPEAYAAGAAQLDSVDRAVLAAIDGRADAREVLTRVPGDPDDARRSLLGLITAALVRRH